MDYKTPAALQVWIRDKELVRRVVEQRMAEGVPQTETVKRALRAYFVRLDERRAILDAAILRSNE